MPPSDPNDSQKKRKEFFGEAKDFAKEPAKDFDRSNPFKDPVSFIRQREYETRENMIAIERAKLIMERLRECYREEGVNHYENCRELVQKYCDAFEGNRLGRINIMRDSK